VVLGQVAAAERRDADREAGGIEVAEPPHRLPRRAIALELLEPVGLDADRIRGDLDPGTHVARVQADADSALRSGVTGTPTFFVGGERHEGAFDVQSLMAASRAVRAVSRRGRRPARR